MADPTSTSNSSAKAAQHELPPFAQNRFTIVKNDIVAPNLTFGIELELIMATRKDMSFRAVREMSPATEAREVVRAVLARDLQARCRLCQQYVRFKLPLDTTVQEESKDDTDYTLWDIVFEKLEISSTELNILGVDYSNYDLYGLEIKSRIVSALKDLAVVDPRPGTCTLHQIPCEQEIGAVLRALRDEFCEFQTGKGMKSHYLFANRSCGFHVHVGNAGKIFDLMDLKKVLCMSIACERLIDSITPPHRINWTPLGTRSLRSFPPYPHGSEYGYMANPGVTNHPLSDAFILAAYRRCQKAQNIGVHPLPLGHVTPKYYPDNLLEDDSILKTAAYRFDIDSWMAIIVQAPRIHELKEIWRYRTKESNVELFSTLGPVPWADMFVRNTVECRRAAGSLQTPVVLSWLDVVVKMFSYCQSQDFGEIVKHIGYRGSLRQPHSTFMDLCRLIGCSDQTIEHYTTLRNGSQKLRSREKSFAQRIECSTDPLVRLALNNIEQERSSFDVEKIDSIAEKKFLDGGYGQFERDFIDSVVQGFQQEVPTSRRERLTTGYKPRDEAATIFNSNISDEAPSMSISKNRSRPSSPASECSERSVAVLSTTGSCDRRGREVGRRSSPAGEIVRSQSPPLLAGKFRSTYRSPASGTRSLGDDTMLPDALRPHFDQESPRGRRRAPRADDGPSAEVPPALRLPSPSLEHTIRTHSPGND